MIFLIALLLQIASADIVLKIL